MTGSSLEVGEAIRDRFVCPACGAALSLAGDSFECRDGGHRFEVTEGIPQLFWPNDWPGDRLDVTDHVKAFYEETPFPDYDEFDSISSLGQKARQGMFAKLLDDQIPAGARVIECGCGTGQLTNFLSIANRVVVGADMCLNSLRLGQGFKQAHDLSRAHFVQMNLFRPVFAPASFDLVISNGVLHHTADPFLAFQTISRLVKPRGFVLIGLYHRWGRLVTDLRRSLFRLSADRLTFLDPNLRAGGMVGNKRRAWFMDQYRNPHESKHTLGEVLGWFEKTGFDFVQSIPSTRPFGHTGEDTRLFEPDAAGSAFERALVELGMVASGSREGGFFVVIGQRCASA